MIDKKSYMRLQNCELCVRYSSSRSMVAAISDRGSYLSEICSDGQNVVDLPVSLPACNALYSSVAASSSRWIPDAFSKDS